MSTTASLTDLERASQTASERVLIVEDDNAARTGLTELVRTWGFLTESAADASHRDVSEPDICRHPGGIRGDHHSAHPVPG